jgi:hypothetical protein
VDQHYAVIDNATLLQKTDPLQAADFVRPTFPAS